MIKIIRYASLVLALAAVALIAPAAHASWTIYQQPGGGTIVTVSSIYRDRTANDATADGTSAHPFKSWVKIATMLGAPPWRVQSPLTISIPAAGGDTDNSDPIDLSDFRCEAGAYVLVEGTLPASQAFSGPITSISQDGAAARAANIQNVMRLNVVGTTGIQANEQLIVDSTHGARWWVTATSASNLVRGTMPLSPVSIPTANTNLAEQHTAVATNDNITLNVPPAVNITRVVPRVADAAPNAYPCVFLHQLRILDPGGIGADAIDWGPSVAGYEIAIDRILNLVGNAETTNAAGCVNCYLAGGFSGSRLGTGKFWHLNGGTIASSATLINAQGMGISIDSDAWINGGTFNDGVQLGLVFVGQTVSAGGGATLQINGNGILAATSGGYSSTAAAVAIWGGASASVLDVSGRGTLDIKTGTGTADLLVTTIQLNETTTGIAVNGSSLTSAITLTGANLDLAVGSGGCGGACFKPGGGSITTY